MFAAVALRGNACAQRDVGGSTLSQLHEEIDQDDGRLNSASPYHDASTGFGARAKKVQASTSPRLTARRIRVPLPPASLSSPRPQRVRQTLRDPRHAALSWRPRLS